MPEGRPGRTAKNVELMLHRKVAAKRECICGSEMEFTDAGWICKHQHKTKEPSSIVIPRKDAHWLTEILKKRGK